MRLTIKTLIGLSLLSTGCGISSNDVTTSDKILAVVTVTLKK